MYITSDYGPLLYDPQAHVVMVLSLGTTGLDGPDLHEMIQSVYEAVSQEQQLVESGEPGSSHPGVKVVCSAFIGGTFY